MFSCPLWKRAKANANTGILRSAQDDGSFIFLMTAGL
jgi:hypothetical protein